MNNLDHTYWFEIARNLFILTATTVGLAFLATRWIRSAAWQRNIWQIAFVSVGILSLSEVSGLTKGVALWFGGKKPEPRKFAVRTFAPTAPAPLPDESFSTAEPLVDSPAIHEDTSVVWPGLVWIIGVAVILSRVFFSQALLLGFRLRRRILSDNQVVEAASRLAERLGLSRNIVLRQSPALRSPIAFGILRKTIVLPENFSKMFTPAQRDAVLAHELAHLAFNDPFWYLVADFVAALFWWNPLVWLARTKLHSTSEDAADEASLLVNDGATTLAECLVHLAKQFASTGAFGWMSIEGNGYRSNLALRVQRLLSLENSEWRAPRRTAAVALKVCIPVLLATLVIVSSAFAQRDKTQPSNLNSAIHQSWNDSVGALALNSVAPQGDSPVVDQAVTPAPSVPAPAKTNSLPAITKQQVQVAHPTYDPASEANAAAAAAAAGLPPVRIKSTPSTNARTAPISSGRQKILTKMESIRLDQFSNDGLPLGELLQELTDRCVKQDSAHVGINFMIDGKGTDSGAMVAMVVPPFHLRDVNISGVLGAIITVSKETIHYSIEDYAIVVSTNLPVAPQLLSRVFKIEPYSFAEALKNTGLVADEPPPKSSATNWTKILNIAAHKYFSAAGIDLEPPKYLFLNDRAGTLFVRAYEKDLDILATAIESLNAAPPQVTIETKFVEISDDDAKAIGFDWFFKTAVGANGTTSFSSNLKSNTNSPTVHVGDRTVTNATGITLSAILSDPQFRIVIKALEQRQGVDILTAPRVTTLSGRQAQISSLDLVTVVKGYTSVKAPDGTTTNNFVTEPLPFGPTLDVIPNVSADGFSLRMQVVATINEFLGYDKPNKDVEKAAPKALKTAGIPLPRIRSRQVSTVAHVWDGQTIVLGGLITEDVRKVKDKVVGLGDVPLVGKLFQKESVTSVKKNLVIFITPTVIDPAGNRVHSDEEMQPLLQKHAPVFQAPPATSASSGMIKLKVN